LQASVSLRSMFAVSFRFLVLNLDTSANSTDAVTACAHVVEAILDADRGTPTCAKR